MIPDIKRACAGVSFVPTMYSHQPSDQSFYVTGDDTIAHNAPNPFVRAPSDSLDPNDHAVRLRVGKAATRSLDRETAIREIAKAGMGIAGAECCGIYLWHRESKQFEVGWEETIGSWPGFLSAGTRFPTANWPTLLQAMEARN